MAAVCLAYHMTPTEYWDLTLEEQRFLVEELQRVNKAHG